MDNEMQRRERDYEGDVIYRVWLCGGNVDSVSYDNIHDDFLNHVSADDCARNEVKKQAKE